MTVWYKQGVIGDLQPVARKGLGRVADLYDSFDSYINEDLFVTSIREGNHKAGSLHYDGLAFDIQLGGRTTGQIREVLGSSWDVVNEENHVHCEFDPK